MEGGTALAFLVHHGLVKNVEACLDGFLGAGSRILGSVFPVVMLFPDSTISFIELCLICYLGIIRMLIYVSHSGAAAQPS